METGSADEYTDLNEGLETLVRLIFRHYLTDDLPGIA